ncbi:hypothetical protein LUZ60_006262 [Juncus effusus]|nr:hypothetical protein LUZ60_006262 [Juncus effusus]
MEIPSFLFSLLLFSLTISTTSEFLSDDTSALLALKSAVGSRTSSLNSWTSFNYTCTAWIGITCNSTDTGPRVFELRLPGTALSGTIPSSTISQLTSLRVISFRFNILTSPLPDDLSNSKNLTGLYLNNNKFTGPIPPVLLTLLSLQRLDLSFNQFSGEVPSSFNNLTELKTLYLQYNNLSGEMPQDLNFPNLVQFNISYNNLTGPIPPGLRKFPASAFLGMKMCGGPLVPCSNETPSPSPSPFGPTPSTSSKNKKKLSAGAIAGIAVGGAAVLLLLLILLVLLIIRRKKDTDQQARDTKTPETGTTTQKAVQSADGAQPGPSSAVAGAIPPVPSVSTVAVPTGRKLVFFRKGEVVKFGLEELLRASAEVLGKGTFGTTYKAVLESGEVVAVKRLKEVSVPEKEFREKVAKVGELEHNNVVPLLAYYYSKDEKLLVCDFMTMGSLSAILHGSRGSGRTPLNWETRAKIALAISQGIRHIHSVGPTSSHGNIKSSNVLLTTTYEARLSDHGLYTLANPQTPFTRVNNNRAPEVTDPKKISQKADVYSFGVLVMELLTGKAPSQAVLTEEGVDLPRWVNSVVKEEWTGEVFDMDLVRYQTVGDDMMQLLQLAMDCTEQHPDKRPDMNRVVERIEEILKTIGGERDASGESGLESGDEIRRSPI